MVDRTPEQIEELRLKVAALRKALDDFEQALLGPESPTVADMELSPELEEFLQNVVPPDEVQRLSEVVPQLTEVTEDERKKNPGKR